MLKPLVLSLMMLIGSLQAQNPSEDNYVLLDSLANNAGTDKGSIGHHYTKVYAEVFGPHREEPLKILEIGIFKGASVKMWEGFFPNAEMHFVDISDENIQYWSTRSSYHFLDQANPQDLQALIESIGGNFDIIIDDGGHTMKQQITSLNALFFALKPGGVYVIEDLCTSYWKAYGGSGSLNYPLAGRHSTTEYLKKLMDDLNYYSAKTTFANFDALSPSFVSQLTPFQKELKNITFHPNLCFLQRR